MQQCDPVLRFPQFVGTIKFMCFAKTQIVKSSNKAATKNNYIGLQTKGSK